MVSGYAPGSGLALATVEVMKYLGRARTRGVAQSTTFTNPAGQSHRLTSGGKAVDLQRPLVGLSTLRLGVNEADDNIQRRVAEKAETLRV